MGMFVRNALVAVILSLSMGAANSVSLPTTFNVNGYFTSDPLVTLTGTLDVNTAAGVVTGASLTVLGLPTFGIVDVSGPDGASGWALELLNGVASNTLHVHFSANPGVNTLVGMTGGSLYAGLVFAPPTFFEIGLTGSITQVSATPLPSTWLMLLSSFLGLGFFAYRGSKKRSALAAA